MRCRSACCGHDHGSRRARSPSWARRATYAALIRFTQIAVSFSACPGWGAGPLLCVQVHGGRASRHRPQIPGRTISMISSTNRRLARGIGAGLAAVAAFGTLGISAASASSGPAPLAGITVPGDATAAPATLVASLEGRNEVTAGATAGQALELIGLQGSTLSYSVSWRGIGTPTEADIHAGVRGVAGPVVVPLFTTPPPADGFASGSVTRSEEHTSELQSRENLVCRLLLEKKKKYNV